MHGFGSEQEMLARIDQYEGAFEVRHLDGTIMRVEDWPASRALNGDFVRDYQLRLKNKFSGWEHIMAYSVAPVRNSRGEVVLIVYVMQDLTGHKQAGQALLREREVAEAEKERLQAVLEILPVAVFIADADGKLVAANFAAEDIWGKVPLSEQPKDYQKDYRAWWPATGKRVQAHEWGMARAISKGERCIAERDGN